MCHVVQMDSSAIKFDRVEIAFILALFLFAEPLTDEGRGGGGGGGRRKPEYPQKTHGDELQKMPHTKARRSKPQARLERAQKPTG